MPLGGKVSVIAALVGYNATPLRLFIYKVNPIVTPKSRCFLKSTVRYRTLPIFKLSWYGMMGVIIHAALWAILSHRVASAWPALQFTKNGTFQITVFEDLHFGEAEDTDWGPLQDVDTLKVMQTVLNNESPQLVVLNGDLITGENTLRDNSTDYVDNIVAPLVEVGLPWASTYGSELSLSSTSLLFVPPPHKVSG